MEKFSIERKVSSFPKVEVYALAYYKKWVEYLVGSSSNTLEIWNLKQSDKITLSKRVYTESMAIFYINEKKVFLALQVLTQIKLKYRIW